jgi:hypothetical protein
MVQRYHVEFLAQNADLLASPVLAVGSRQYDYDPVDLAGELRNLGCDDVFGVDILDGPGVDAVVDITEPDSAFVAERSGSFGTIVCFEVLTNVVAPQRASTNMQRLARPGAGVLLAECVVRKLSRMPVDYWRYTPEGLIALFAGVDFDRSRSCVARTREKAGVLSPFEHDLPEINHSRHAHESRAGHLLRRVHRKLLAKGDFTVSRSFPELTVLVAGRRSERDELIP